MNKAKLFIALAVAAITGVHAQGLYFGLGAGYGFSAARHGMGADQKTSGSGSSSSTEITSRSGSYGNGINLMLYGGNMFNEYIGAELGFNMLLGGKLEERTENPNSIVAEVSKGSAFRIIPALRLSVPVDDHRLYMRAGPIFGLGMKVSSDRRTENTGGSSNTVIEHRWEYSGGVSFGFHNAVGFSIHLSDNLQFFLEAAGYFQSWAPDRSALTKYTVNGEDRLLTMNKRERETNYEDKYTIGGGSQPDEPDTDSRIWLPFSSLGMNVGIQFNLTK